MNEKWSIDELEMIYLTEYDEEDNDENEDTGDEVQNFLNWCRNNLSHVE